MGWGFDTGDIAKMLEKKVAAKQTAPPTTRPDGFVGKTIPPAMARGGGDNKHPVPRQTVNPQRQAAIDKMKRSMNSYRQQPHRVGLDAPEVKVTVRRVQRRLAQQKIKGDVTAGTDENGFAYVQGPKGRRYPVWKSESA